MRGEGRRGRGGGLRRGDEIRYLATGHFFLSKNSS